MSSTRRSAGLPYCVVACLLARPSLLEETMEKLLHIASSGKAGACEHAFNCIRAVVQDSVLIVPSFMEEKAFEVCLHQFGSKM